MATSVFSLLIAVFMACYVQQAAAVTYTSMSINVPAFAKECLYYRMDSEEDSVLVNFQVLTGGNFEIDFEITAPNGDKVITANDKRYADYLVRSFGLGEYSFCFSNRVSTVTPKKVEFSIELERDVDYYNQQETTKNKDEIMSEHAISEISRNYDQMRKMLDYLRAREWRNMSTVKSTESRVYWLGLLSSLAMIGLGVAQATLVQFMFSGPRSLV
ncbi:Erp2 protein [Saccharomycopsis crataegensis]|uniref:Erp2 protein n=1 Tax=Saccharomycopsis crataegensis TaxID=43959 RepID=A0AAV5QQZ2_9ASCO|nr:Erp2 protein [Saccharomycopsis crataegensis]